MTEPKFTRGPWVQCDGFGPSIHGTAVMEASGEAEGNMICSCTGYFGRETAQANAALIAAAPDLFEALSEILSYSGGAANALEDPYVMERAHAALAKSLNTSSEKDAG